MIYFFYKSKRKFISVNYALNLIIVGLFIWNGTFLIYQLKNKNNISIKNNIDIKHNSFNTIQKHLEDKPDIYFIVLDGYANENVLKKYYNYDNSKFIDFLKKNNFQVIDSCRSNYYGTLLSLSSTLNIKYFNDEELENSQEIINQLRDNYVFREFKKNGYSIVQLKSGYSVTSFFNLTDSTILIDAPNEFERAILRYSMFRLDDIFGQIPYLRLKSQFEIFTNWKVNSLVPTFNFIHIVCPHPPYIFNAKGERFYKSNYTDNSWEPKENYIEQLAFVNNHVEKFLNNINTQYKKLNKEPIIVLLSDHGPYLKSNNKEDVFEIRSKILYAIKTPSSELILNYNTSVNTFPFVLNNFLGYNLNYLPDSLAGEAIFKESTQFKNLIN
ncbi:MAG: sulfatase-like hydrolase/transferase [Bacteroidia bacterium]